MERAKEGKLHGFVRVPPAAVRGLGGVAKAHIHERLCAAPARLVRQRPAVVAAAAACWQMSLGLSVARRAVQVNGPDGHGKLA